MLNVLVADQLPAAKVEEIKKIPGISCQYRPDLTEENLMDAVESTHILCVRSTRVTEATIAKARALMLIIRVGSGTNTIHVDAASHRGIYVANCPGKNAVAVAELALGLMLALDRQIPQATASLRNHQWQKKLYSKAQGIKGKRLGLVGFGQIGKAVAKRALSFEMQVVAYDKILTPTQAEQEEVIFCADLDQLCRECDVISLHLPYNPETRHLFSRERFGLMKPGCIFINTSRGEIHDQAALLDAMNEKGLRVGLDVFEQEPAAEGTFDAPILQHPNFVGTPHIGASTQQAQDAVADEAIRIIRDFVEHGIVHHCVNLQEHTDVQVQMIVRHFNKVGVLASVMELLRMYDINIEGMSNTIFKEGKTAVAVMELSHVPPNDLLSQLQSMEDKIIHVTVNHQGND